MNKRAEGSFPTFWRLQMQGWAGLYLLTLLDTLPHLFREPESFWGRVGGDTLGCGIMFLASCALRPICRSLVKRSLSWFAFQLSAFLWAALIGVAAGALVQLFVVQFPAPNWNDLISNYLRYPIFLLFWCNLYFGIKHWQYSVEEREQLVRAEAAAREAKLNALRYQLNPHFLFNALNAASTLAVEGDVPAATRMLAQIGDLLRGSLDGNKGLEVSLAEEMVFTRHYLAIEQTRLGERLEVELSIGAETLEAAVPNMLLQPLIENAVRHGVAPAVDGGKIAMRSALNNQMLQISIKNTGSRSSSTRHADRGIGLGNTIERLNTLYGANHKFELNWPESGGCDVRIEIPFHRVHSEEGLSCGY